MKTVPVPVDPEISRVGEDRWSPVTRVGVVVVLGTLLVTDRRRVRKGEDRDLDGGSTVVLSDGYCPPELPLSPSRSWLGDVRVPGGVCRVVS